jgi:RNA recognition motif-containing protein
LYGIDSYLVVDDKTLYASYLPKDSDKNFVKKIFSPFGNIKRIDLPSDKSSGVIKGIAFIEFETLEQSKQALKGIKFNL